MTINKIISLCIFFILCCIIIPWHENQNDKMRRKKVLFQSIFCRIVIINLFMYFLNIYLFFIFFQLQILNRKTLSARNRYLNNSFRRCSPSNESNFINNTTDKVIIKQHSNCTEKSDEKETLLPKLKSLSVVKLSRMSSIDDDNTIRSSERLNFIHKTNDNTINLKRQCRKLSKSSVISLNNSHPLMLGSKFNNTLSRCKIINWQHFLVFIIIFLLNISTINCLAARQEGKSYNLS